MPERTSWCWEYAVKRADGRVLMSAADGHPCSHNDAKIQANRLNANAKDIGRPDLKASIVRRKRTVTVRTEIGGWQSA